MLDMSSTDKEDERYEHHLEQRSLRNQKANLTAEQVKTLARYEQQRLDGETLWLF